MICEAGDIVVISLSSRDGTRTISRPAVVISERTYNQEGCSILAMITDSRHPNQKFDTPISFRAGNMKMANIVRTKLFTVENHHIVRRLDDLCGMDRTRVFDTLRKLLPSR